MCPLNNLRIEGATLMRSPTPLFESLEERRLFSVSIGSIADASHVPGTPADTVDHRARATLTAQGVGASAGDKVRSVTYFIDRNGDGVLDRRDRVIGRSRNAGNDFRVTRRIRQDRGVGADGTVTVSAVAHGRDGRDDVSPVVTADITVVDAAPTISKLTASPKRPAPGRSLVIRAHGVAARGDGITNVEFFQDTNGDGRIDDGDIDLGAGTREHRRLIGFDTGDIEDGDLGEVFITRPGRRHTWRFDASNVTTGAAKGTSFNFLAQVSDTSGAVSSVSSPPGVTVTVR
jgi:hypothetical protein